MGTRTVNSREATNTTNNEQHSPGGTFSTDRAWNMPENGWIDRIWVWSGSFSDPSASFTFLLYRTDTGAIAAQTPATCCFGVGYGWNSGVLSLNSGNNNSGGYNSPFFRAPGGYSMSFGFYAPGGTQASFLTPGGGSHWWGSGGPNNWKVGTQNQFAVGGLWAYAEYFPDATVTGIPNTPIAPGSHFTVNGLSFSAGVNSVTIGGVAAAGWSVVNDTTLDVTAPNTGAQGQVTVNTNAGSATSAGSMIVGLIKWGDASGNGVVHTAVAVKYGDPSGNGVVHNVAGVWVPNGAGVKRIW